MYFTKQVFSVPDILNLTFGMTKNTAPFNVTGHPALSVNAGFSQNLPIGCMFVGRNFDDITVLQVGYAFEKLTTSYGH